MALKYPELLTTLESRTAGPGVRVPHDLGGWTGRGLNGTSLWFTHHLVLVTAAVGRLDNLGHLSRH